MEKMAGFIKSKIPSGEKLLEAIKCAVGKIYEPHYVKQMANARAYEIAKVSEAMRESSDIPINYSNGELSMATTDEEAFYRRTQSRLAYQEMRKQQNIESIIGQTYSLLEDTPQVEDTPTDQDWMLRFFHAVENISNEQMQLLWSKLLANEITRPNSFSLRTLDVLKNMSPSEAKLFSDIAPYVLKCYGDEKKSYYDYFLPNMFDERMYSSDYGLSFSEIYPLCDAGVLSSNSTIGTSLCIQKGECEYIEGEGKRLKIRNIKGDVLKVGFPIYILTTAGIELLPVVMASQEKAPNSYFEDVCRALKSVYDKTELTIEDNIMQ